MGWVADKEREFWRRKCMDSFWWFFRYAYGYDFNPKGAAGPSPWLDEATHKPICDWYEKHALSWLADHKAGKGKQRKLMAIVPRDFGKTTLLTQAGQVWLHLHDPELATYTGCETVTRAREVLNGIKAIISGEDRYSRYGWLYGNQKHPKRQWKLDGVVTASRTNLARRDASYGTWAIESGLVGMHPDAAFFDDPNTYEKMERKGDWLDIVNRHLDTLVPVFQKDAFWMLTLTRYGDGDHAGKSLKLEGCASCEGMPMPGLIIEPDGAWHVFFLDAVDAQDRPTMPKIWPADRIRTFERRNPTRYWAQVRNNPTQTPYNVLPRSLADRMIISPEDIDIKKLRVSLHFDTAFKDPRRKARGDSNVISAVGHEAKTGICYFLGARGSTEWESEAFGEQLTSVIKEWRGKGARISCMTDEEDIGGKPGLWQAFVLTVLRKNGITPIPELLIFVRERRRKEERLASAAALWRDGRMKLLRDAPGLEMLLDQMTKIGMSDHDDYADATADCYRKEVYSVLWPKEGEVVRTSSGNNPFDDVLKPGPIGVEAAEQIAGMYAKRESMYADCVFDDVVHP